MSNRSSTSTSSTSAKKPRRHPTSRGMRKHVREEKRLGFMENHDQRKARLESQYFKPKKAKKEGSRGKGGGIQQVRLSELKIARTVQNLCPAPGCGCLTSGACVTVIDQATGVTVTMQVRRCSRCGALYRSFEAPIYAKLPAATNNFNDCAYNCGWTSGSNTGHVSSIDTIDAGRQLLCTCGKCGKVYKPYVASVKSWGDLSRY